MNTFTALGRLGQNAEYNPEKKILKYSVAVNTGYKKNRQTMWVNCAMFGEHGSNLELYLTKGTPVLVAGELSLYQTKEGKSVPTLKVTQLELQGQVKQDPAKESSQAQETNEDIPF